MHDLADVCEPAVTVVAIGDSNDVALYRDLIQAGVTEYLFKPVTPQLLAKAHQRRSPSAARRSARSSASSSPASARAAASGRRSIATGLAWHLANQQNRRVALADLDLQHGDCALALNFKPTPGWREALANPMRVDTVFLDRVCREGRRAARSC